MNRSIVFACPTCSTVVSQLATTSPDSLPDVGSLYICGDCATLSTFHSRGLRKLNQRQLRRITPDELREIRFAVRNILARAVHNGDIQQQTELGLS